MKTLILCVETNKEKPTDTVYIDKVIKSIYNIDNSVKIAYIYLDGKGNFRRANIIKQINNISKKTKNSKVSVIYFIDTDKYDSDTDDITLNENIKLFCKQEGYGLVWFCYDIEDVFLHKKVSDHDKISEAKNFSNSCNFEQTHKFIKADELALSTSQMARRKSNMLCILDDILQRK